MGYAPLDGGHALLPRRILFGMVAVFVAMPLAAPHAEPVALDINGLVASQTPVPLEAQAGLITVPGGVSLVSHGSYRARGRVTQGAMLGGTIDVSVAETDGAEAGAIGIVPDPLAVWSERRTVALRSELADRSDYRIGVSATLLESRNRTVDPARGQRVSGMKNTAFGTGARLGLWENRLRVDNELAWSTPERKEAEGRRTGQANRHRLEADLVRTENLTVTGLAGWSEVGRDYTARSDAPADRATWRTGARARYSFLGMELYRTGYRTNVKPAEGVLTLRNTTETAAVTLALDKALPSSISGPLPYATALFPSTVRFQRDHGRVRDLPGESIGSFAPADIADHARATDTLSFDWRRSRAHTGAILTRSKTDNRQTGREAADSEESAFTFSQSFSPEGWAAGLAVSLGETLHLEPGNRSRAERVSLSATFSASARDQAPWTATFGVSQRRVDHIDTGKTGIDTGWHATAATDLSPALLDDALRNAGRFSLMVGAGGRESDQGGARSHRIDFRMGVQAAMSF